MNPDEYLTLGEAEARSGLGRRTLQDRIVDANVAVFQDARDRRRHMIHIADLPRLMAPLPAVTPAPRRKISGVVPRRTAVLSDAADSWSAIEHPEESV